MSYDDIPPGFSIYDAPNTQSYGDIPPGFSVAPDAAKQPQAPPQWSDLPGNIPGSAWQLAKDATAPIHSPMQTAGGLHALFSGLGAKFGYGDPANEPVVDAVGQFFKDRYGSLDAIKNTVIKDPVGAAADLSTVLTGGAALPARAGIAGAKAVGTVGRAIDPVTNALRGVEAVAGKALPVALGTTTGAGNEAIRTGFNAGRQGGDASEAFQGSMRGTIPLESVVEDAKIAAGNMRADRSAQYRQGMAGVARDTTELSFEPLANAIVDSNKIKTFHGEDLHPRTAAVRSEILGELDNWRQLSAYDPAFRTAEGFDALKQKIGDIKDAQPYGSPSRAVATQAYGAVRDTIVKQAPAYAKVMQDYERASTMLDEVGRTLSLKPGATTDTTLRKLQSVMRNNVNTNYGKRAELAQALTKNGAPQLMEKLAGQSLNSYMPRGLSQVPASGGLLALALNPALWPKIAAYAAASSPRLVGEGAHAAGKLSRGTTREGIREALIAALNAGRLPAE